MRRIGWRVDRQRGIVLVVGLWLALAPLPVVASPGVAAEAPSPEATAPVVDPGVARLAIPPGRERLARRLISDVGFMKTGEGGLLFSSIALSEREVTYEIRRAAELPGGPVLGSLNLAPRGLARSGEQTSTSFVLRSTNPGQDSGVAALLGAGKASVISNDTGGFYIEREDVVVEDLQALAVELPREVTETLGTRWELFREWEVSGMVQALTHLAYGGAALLIWGLILLVLIPFRERDYSFGKKLKANHLLPVGVQILLFAYWGLYWSEVGPHALLILLQLVFALGFDFLLGVSIQRRWVATFGSIPIVLSANLFVWFPADKFYLSMVVIALALLSKAFLQRSGRHIFNPSAVGIAVVGVLCITMPDLYPYRDIAHQLNLPPNMLEIIFLLALLPQTRVPIVLVSLASVLTIYPLASLHPLMRPGPMWPAIFLAITLLATDPSTIPRTGIGRVAFGVVLGLGTVAISTLLELGGTSDFFGKVFAIPVANALVPWFDGLSKRLPGWLEQSLGPRRNAQHVVAWAILILIWSYSGDSKQGGFEARWHEENRTPLVVFGPDGHPTCADNPIFCEPFSLGGEAQGWSSALSRPPEK